MTRRDRRFAGTVKDTISSSFRAAKPNASAARAPSIAYPCPQCSCARRHPISTHGVNGAAKPGLASPTYPAKAVAPGTSTAQSPQPCVVDVRRDSLGERVALVAGQDGREELHHAWIGVERREWLPVVRPSRRAGAAAA